MATTVGDIYQAMYRQTDSDPKWAEGGLYKIALQGAGAALVAQLGNGEGLNAALDGGRKPIRAYSIPVFGC